MMSLPMGIVLAPSSVVAASLVERRFGSRIGGIFAALPIVAGPILLLYAMEEGIGFAAEAAAGMLLGLVSLSVFVVAYVYIASRVNYLVALSCGGVAFLVSTAVLNEIHLAPGAALVLVATTISAALLVLPEPRTVDDKVIRRPRSDLPFRAAAALALVLSLTIAANSLGPWLSGLLTPFPVVVSVLAAFTQVQGGTEAVRQLLRGTVVGLFAFSLFGFVLAVTLRPAGLTAAFALAAGAALALQAAVLYVSRRRQMIAESAQPLSSSHLIC